MNRRVNKREHHKAQVQFEKLMKARNRLVQKNIARNKWTKETAEEAVDGVLHTKGIHFLSYCQYKRKYSKITLERLVKVLKEILK